MEQCHLALVDWMILIDPTRRRGAGKFEGYIRQGLLSVAAWGESTSN
jgi:hypothetical protein